MNYSDIARCVIEKELACMNQLYSLLGISFDNFVSRLDSCKGTLVWTGVGKSGHICRKIVATMQSLGIKSIFIHPVEALHGDLGVLSSDDVVVAVSNSGETREILNLIQPLRNLQVEILSITGKNNSTLERLSDGALVITGLKEAFLDIVPTSSTTCTLVLGDAIAASIATKRKFTQDDFGKFHPQGQLGKRLTLRNHDVMLSGNDNSVIVEGSTLEQAVYEMCKKSISAVSIVDADGYLKGYFTDGDFRRFMSSNCEKINSICIDDIMRINPICLKENELLYDTIQNTISKHTFTSYPVIDCMGKAAGTIRMIDVVNSGLLS